MGIGYNNIMDAETEIQQTLKQNIPQAPQHVMAAPVVGDAQEVPIEYGLDEITLYKLQQHFGETYKEGDITGNKQMSYIYDAVSEQLGTKDYPVVVAKINDLKRMLGLNHTSNPRFKLYQWLKLDQKRSRIEMEMSNVQEAL